MRADPNTLMPGPFLTDVSKAWDIEATEAGAQSFALKRLGKPAEIVGAGPHGAQGLLRRGLEAPDRRADRLGPARPRRRVVDLRL